MKTRYASLHSKGLEVITVFESTIENLVKGAGSATPPFLMLSNPARDMYQLYAVESSVAGFARTVAKKLDQAWQFKSAIKQVEVGQTVTRMPADFLIDEKGVIDVVHYGTDAGDHLSFETIEAWLATKRQS
jgi:peroxiredoxin Q/BCP